MSSEFTTLVCDNVYQLYLAWALSSLEMLPHRIDGVLSIGESRVEKRAAEVAAELGARHAHLVYGASVKRQAGARRSIGRLSARVRALLEPTRHLVIFNDLHPGTIGIYRRCRPVTVSLIEEGVGVHRTRRANGRARPGRMGEAPWIDELWVSQTETLTPYQRRKRIVTFDRGQAIAAMRGRWATTPKLADGTRPLLLMIGQPFVEDRVLTRAQFDAILDDVAGAIPGTIRARVSLAYKPHPRERAPRRAAARAFGEDVVMLDQEAPLETLDFGNRRLFVLTFTSGATRALADDWRVVSVVRCFPALAGELEDPRTYPGVTFLDALSGLRPQLEAFSRSARHGVPA